MTEAAQHREHRQLGGWSRRSRRAVVSLALVGAFVVADRGTATTNTAADGPKIVASSSLASRPAVVYQVSCKEVCSYFPDPPQEWHFKRTPLLPARCGDTVRFRAADPQARIGLQMSGGVTVKGGREVEVPLYRLSGVLRVDITVHGKDYWSRELVRLSVPACADAPRLPPLEPNEWPVAVASSSLGEVRPTLLNACRELDDCYLRVPRSAWQAPRPAGDVISLAVQCRTSYTLFLPGLREAVIDGRRITARPGASGVRVRYAVTADPDWARVGVQNLSVTAPGYELLEYRFSVDRRCAAPELVAVDELPGFGTTVPFVAAIALEQATVRLLRRPLTGGRWDVSCTAVRIRAGENTAFSTAAHCFADERNVARSKPAGAFVDVTADAHNEYGLARNRGADWSDPIPISRLLVYSGIADWAIVTTAETTETALGDVHPVPFVAPVQAPVAGQQVALFSLPLARAAGVYLGRLTQRPGPSTQMTYDVVGIDPRSPQHDPCYLGSSGSSPMLPDGTLLGPLAAAARVGYGDPPQPEPGQPTDQYYRGVLLRDLRERLHLRFDEAEFSKRFPTLCLYSVPDRPLSEALERAVREP